MVSLLAAAGCDDKKTSDAGPPPPPPPPTEAGAKQLLTHFVKPGADLKTLSQALRPSRTDFEAVFTDEAATRLASLYAPEWEAGNLVISPAEGQTEVIVRAVPSAEIKAWSRVAADNLPGGYEKIKDHIKDGVTVYSFKFVKPGETSGTSFDGLVNVNGQWRVFPKPYRREG
jgi:hypothetical protein